MAKSKINAEIELKANGTASVARDVNKVTDSVKKSTKVVDELKKSLTSTGNPFKQFGNVLNVVDARFDALGNYAAKAKRKIVETRMEIMKISKATIGGISLLAGGAAFAVGSVFTAVKGVTSNIDSISKFSRSVGMSAVQLQQWQYAAQRSGMTTEQFDNSIRKFSSNVSEAVGGEKKQLDLFNALGISLKDNKGKIKDNSQLMLELAGAYDKVSNAQDKVRITEELFGRGAIGITNLFEGGQAGLQALLERRARIGGMFTEEDAKNAEAFDDLLLDISMVMDGIKNKFVGEMMPSLNQGMNDFLDVWDKNGGKILEKTRIAAGVVGESFIELVKLTGEWCDVIDNADQLFSVTGKDVKFILKEIFEGIKDIVRWWQDVPLIGDVIKWGKGVLTSGRPQEDVVPRQTTNPQFVNTTSTYTENRNTTTTSKVMIDVRGNNGVNYDVDVDEAFSKDKNVDLNTGYVFSY